ncbi:putative GTP-binding protein EngB [Cyphellophora attinorum]|uniref:Putative GTP-binding protein EngB n=1 Tax=Cyphellophora attinorum TaxID=1664694 RepID=A0A0N1HVB1_9EURO|nr:putative GTP-binding protein EngB [Phialophora attinorum]KPI43656.1 putative GTP-binding protein EngB [Phialophora attinorum]
MPTSLCNPCRTLFRRRLQVKLKHLEQSRHATTRSAAVARSAQSLSLYWDTTAPTERNLTVARWFFESHRVSRLWTASQWRTNNNHDELLSVPEVVFLGRSNVGKSSLLNHILNVPNLNRVGDTPGKTKEMIAWGLSTTLPGGGAMPGWKGMTDTRLAVLDAPGYGHNSAADWGNEIVTYMKRRRQLKRIFLLIDSSHGAKKHDIQMMDLLRAQSIPFQLIACKIDRQKEDTVDEALQQLRHFAQPPDTPGMKALGELLVCGSLDRPERTIGVNHIRWAVLRATGLEVFASENYKRLVQGVLHVKPQSTDTPVPSLERNASPSKFSMADILDIMEGKRSQPRSTTSTPLQRAMIQTVFSGLAALEEVAGIKPPQPQPAPKTRKRGQSTPRRAANTGLPSARKDHSAPTQPRQEYKPPATATTSAIAATQIKPNVFSGLAALEAVAGINKPSQAGNAGKGRKRKRR